MGSKESSHEQFSSIKAATLAAGKATTDFQYEAIPEDWPWIWALREKSLWINDDGDDDDLSKDKDKKEEEGEVPDWKRRLQLPVAISDQLYLASAGSITKVHRLKELGITSVLNMAGPMALPKITIRALKANNISYHRISAQDDRNYPLLQNHWAEALEIVSSACSSTTTSNDDSKTKKCAVNCIAGMNRSVLIVAAYHMITTQTPVLETVRHIRKLRGHVALENEGFQEQLVALARRHNLLGPSPGTEGSFLQHVSVPPLPPSEEEWRVSKRPPPPPKSDPLDRLAAAS